MRSTTAHPRSLSQRAAWFFAASALTLALALGGCRAGAHNSGSQTPPQTQQAPAGSSSSPSTAATTGSNNSSSLQQLENIDGQDQSDSSQLNSAQNDAGVNYSSQENNTLP